MGSRTNHPICLSDGCRHTGNLDTGLPTLVHVSPNGYAFCACHADEAPAFGVQPFECKEVDCGATE